MASISVSISNRQRGHAVDRRPLRRAVTAVLRAEGIAKAQIDVAVVGDAESHQLNVEYLAHDYPTDVLSFPLERSEAGLEGQIVVNADYAAAMAKEIGWSPAEELLLYVIHGTLHLAGYDDKTAAKRKKMRQRETEILASLGIERPDAGA